MNSTEACIALNMVAKMGPVRLRKLLEVFETPERILAAKRSELRGVEGIGNEVAEEIANWESSVDLAAELERIREFGAEVITAQSPSYPRQLREIHAPPIVLYVWGELTERDQHAIGVIGSRRKSHYGAECAKKLSYQLAYAGLTVISGLARGIDTAAHQGAIAAKGRTIAVIGSGLTKLYPPENAALAEKIRSGNGAVVTEFSMTVEPDRQTFPMRNRIISGWSHGILVVEAGLNSGALITASQAIEQGRSVYAVPGHINAPTAHGSNRLIQQGAKLVFVEAPGVGVLRADHFLVEKVCNRIVESLHAVLLADLQHAGNLECLGLADQVGDCRCDDEYFQGADAAFRVRAARHVASIGA